MPLHYYYFLLGEIIEDDFNVDNESCCTKYKLTGIVVHSGQASGGHYYSYILHRLVPILSVYYLNFQFNVEINNYIFFKDINANFLYCFGI